MEALDGDEKSAVDYADDAMKRLFEESEQPPQASSGDGANSNEPNDEAVPLAAPIPTTRVVLFEDEVMAVLVGGATTGASELEVSFGECFF